MNPELRRDHAASAPATPTKDKMRVAAGQNQDQGADHR
jgi:hypothetical protein